MDAAAGPSDGSDGVLAEHAAGERGRSEAGVDPAGGCDGRPERREPLRGLRGIGSGERDVRGGRREGGGDPDGRVSVRGRGTGGEGDDGEGGKLRLSTNQFSVTKTMQPFSLVKSASYLLSEGNVYLGTVPYRSPNMHPNPDFYKLSVISVSPLTL